MTEIKLNTEDHDIHDLIRYLDGDHHMSVFDRQRVVNDLKAQIWKPTIEEPTDFGSVVRATDPSDVPAEPRLWHPAPSHGKHYWESETGAVEEWPELTDVEVLRVGLGEADEDLRDAAERLIDMLDSSPETAAFIAKRYSGLDHSLDLVRRNLTQTDDGATPAGAGSPESDSTVPSSPADSDAYARGVADMDAEVAQVVRRLARLNLDAITAAEKRCYETAGNMVAGLLGDS